MIDDVDLNLLRVLDALLDTGSVTGAAKRLHLSTPAVSRALGRLRRTFDDQLFVRAGRSLTTTPRADELRVPVRAVLVQLDALFTPPGDVDPLALEGRFTIIADDAVVAALGLPVLADLHDHAPGVEVTFVPDTDEIELLRTGAADLDIGVHGDRHAELRSEELFTDRFVSAVRADHPLAGDGFDLDTYCASHHVTVSRRARHLGPVDHVLAERGRERQRITCVPSFVVAVHIAASSDLVALVPRSVVDAFSDRLPIVAVDLPLTLPPVTIRQTWHARRTDDPTHRWLRGRVAATVRSLVDERV